MWAAALCLDTKLGHLEPMAMIQLVHSRGCKDRMISFALHVRKTKEWVGHLWVGLVWELRDVIRLSLPSTSGSAFAWTASFSGALPTQGTPSPLGSAEENLCLPKFHPSSQNGV